MTLRVGVVCEGTADARTGCHLADRVVCDQVEWITLDTIEHQRRWRGLVEVEDFLRWSRVFAESRLRGIRIDGHFDGEPGAPDARAARTALALFNAMEPRPDAVVLLRDEDGQSARRDGLRQARGSMEPGLRFPVVIGLAHVMRECWVVAGFVPRTDTEDEKLTRLRDGDQLGFDPTMHPERLTARGGNARKSSKRVLVHLTDDSHERESDCWTKTPLETLAQRGMKIGLSEYLRDVCERIVPLFANGPPQNCERFTPE